VERDFFRELPVEFSGSRSANDTDHAGDRDATDFADTSHTAGEQSKDELAPAFELSIRLPILLRTISVSHHLLRVPLFLFIGHDPCSLYGIDSRNAPSRPPLYTSVRHIIAA
jgi:hypothetical protein